MAATRVASVVVGLLLAAVCGTDAYFSPTVVTPSGYVASAHSGNSTLYRIQANSSRYASAPYLAVLQGSRHSMGYDYGMLMGEAIEESYKMFLDSLLGPYINRTLPREIAEDVLGAVLDWQWNKYLQDQTPAIFLEEFAGMDAAGKAQNLSGLGKKVRRTVTLANMPGDVSDILLVIIRELFGDAVADAFGPAHPPTESFAGFCSMIAAWGQRTAKGHAYAGRNLDWNKDLGLNKYKTVIVYRPNDGAHFHATVGYAPLWGAITGMSSQGLTVHEANLEENRITFEGVPWLLRLRLVMEQANNLKAAQTIWENTNNTVGFNHMVSSAPDALQGGPAAIVMETMFNYTAYFFDNDTRESAAVDGKQEHIGYPMADALWRTNHGYGQCGEVNRVPQLDPTIREHYEWSDNLVSNTVFRYMIIHDAVKTYEEESKPISLFEMVNITSLVGNNGGNDRSKYYTCADSNNGSNVISVAFAPNDLQMAVAWERSTGADWRPACCSDYFLLDMNRWFN